MAQAGLERPLSAANPAQAGFLCSQHLRPPRGAGRAGPWTAWPWETALAAYGGMGWAMLLGASAQQSSLSLRRPRAELWKPQSVARCPDRCGGSRKWGQDHPLLGDMRWRNGSPGGEGTPSLPGAPAPPLTPRKPLEGIVRVPADPAWSGVQQARMRAAGVSPPPASSAPGRGSARRLQAPGSF